VWAEAGAAQSSQDLEALTREVEALKQGQAELQKEIQELKDLLGKRASPRSTAPGRDVVVGIEGAPFLGDPGAAVTLIEFSDYQCPFCARHARQTLPQIERDYVKTGKLRYVLVDSPIEAIHPQAFKGHEAARCAGDQGKYWPMHTRIFANQHALSANDLTAHAQSLGLDAPGFRRCLDSGKHAGAVRRSMAEARKAGVTGTPTFFLGLTDGRDFKVKALRVILGAKGYAQFKEDIDVLLQSAAKPAN
jgi:protein-disulfide isomerase